MIIITKINLKSSSMLDATLYSTNQPILSHYFNLRHGVYNFLLWSFVYCEVGSTVACRGGWAWACCFWCMICFLFILAFAELDLFVYWWLSLLLMPIVSVDRV